MTMMITLKMCANPRLRLICVPHAGGWPSSFQAWRHYVPNDVELIVAQLPGRGSQLYEAPLRSMTALVERLMDVLKPYLDTPITLYGHSFGSIVCYELGKRLPQLVSLNVSAMRAPHVVASRPFVHLMDDAALLSNLQRMGGISTQLLDNEKLRPYVFNTIRADFEALETYRCVYSQLTDAPINVFGATDDPAVPNDVLFSWHRYSRSQVTLHWLQGGHFYPYKEANAERILASIIM